MISNSSKYAIKAVLFLASHTDKNTKMMVKDVATPINVPQAYVAKLLQKLAKNSVISSTRGPKGGFYLTELNRKMSLMSIMEVIDGDKKFTTCMLSLKNCNYDSPCPLHEIIHPLKTELVERLKKATIEDLSNEVASGTAFLPL